MAHIHHINAIITGQTAEQDAQMNEQQQQQNQIVCNSEPCNGFLLRGQWVCECLKTKK